MTDRKYKIGIVGGTGFTGGELIRILLGHANVEIAWVYSRSQAGESLGSVHADLDGIFDLHFTSECAWDIDVVFLCLPHETARNFVEEAAIPEKVILIDLSRDFRLDPQNDGFVYGLPELWKKEIMSSKKVANPGCFATAIQLALLPLAKEKVLSSDVHITGITGSTGAGKGLSATTHFTWRTGNVSVYKALRHQHISEILQSIRFLDPKFGHRVHFVPIRGNFTRGILASVYTSFNGSKEDAIQIYKDFYKGHPFVRVTSKEIDMKQVVGTNMVRISIDVIDGQIHIVSTIDNLIKGASGQAVQNMNLVLGLKETTGLQFKSIGY